MGAIMEDGGRLESDFDELRPASDVGDTAESSRAGVQELVAALERRLDQQAARTHQRLDDLSHLIRQESAEARRQVGEIAERLDARYRLAMEAWDVTRESVARESKTRLDGDRALDVRVLALEARRARRSQS